MRRAGSGMPVRASRSIARSRAAPAAEPLVQAEHLADLRADRVQRIERRHRLLEDHGDLAAADRAHLAARLLAQVGTVEHDPAAALGAVDEAEDRQRGDRLARTRLAHQGELLAGRDLDRDVVDDHGRAEAHRQVLDREERRHRADRAEEAMPRASTGGAAAARARRAHRHRIHHALCFVGGDSSDSQLARSPALRAGALQSASSSVCKRVMAARWAPERFHACSLLPTFFSARPLRS